MIWVAEIFIFIFIGLNIFSVGTTLRNSSSAEKRWFWIMVIGAFIVLEAPLISVVKL